LGKLAATFWYPGKTAVRFAPKAEFLDRLGTQEFFPYRNRGVEPSAIPAEVAQAAMDWTLTLRDDEIFAVTRRPDFSYTPRKGSFNKSLCTASGEYVLERYARLRDAKPYCIPCAGCAP
jgi:formylmethanofuran dehydrogenase subunit E